MLGIDRDTARKTWTVFVIALLIWVIYLVRKPLLIFVLAIFFAYVVYPLVRFAERERRVRIPRLAAIIIVYLLVIIVIVGVVGVIGSTIADQATALANQLPAFINDPSGLYKIPLPHWLEPMRARGIAIIQQQFRANTSAANALPALRSAGTKVLQIGGHLIYVVLVPLLSFIFVKDAPLIRRQISEWLANSRHQPMWDGILTDMGFMLEHYIRSLLLLSLSTLTFYSIALSLMKVPYAILLAAVGAVLEVIPLLGPLAAIVIAFLVALFSGYSHLLWLVAFFAAFRTMQDYVFNPYLMSEGVEVHPLLVIFGIIAGDEIAGITGMFLSIPVLAAAKIILIRVRHEIASKHGQPAPVATVDRGAGIEPHSDKKRQ